MEDAIDLLNFFGLSVSCKSQKSVTLEHWSVL